MPLVVDEAEDSQPEGSVGGPDLASKTSVIAANLKPKTSNINQVFLQKRHLNSKRHQGISPGPVNPSAVNGSKSQSDLIASVASMSKMMGRLEQAK